MHCSAYYLQSCGANRRTAGVVTDIDRPDNHVCGASRSRWKERVNVKGETHTARKEMLDVVYKKCVCYEIYIFHIFLIYMYTEVL